MNCKKCGTEYPADAVYCGGCGCRVDGKKVCFSCGNLNDENNAYCIYCGTRIDGKKVCVSCGVAHEGAFCPSCGAADRAVVPAPAVSAAAKLQRPKTKGLFKKIVGYVSGGLGMMSVLFALIFVFLIGFSSSLSGTTGNLGVSVDTAGFTSSNKLYYFFGDVYKDFKTLGIEKTFADNLTKASFYSYAVTGTLLSAGTIVAVLSFAAVAITVYVRNLLGYTQKTCGKWVVACVASYLGGMVSLCALSEVFVEMTYSFDWSVKNGLDGASKTGLILCTIFLTLHIVGGLLSRGKEAFTGKNIVKFALSLGGVVFVIVLLACLANVGLTIAVEEGATGSSDTSEIKVRMSSILAAFGFIPTLANELESSSAPVVLSSNLLDELYICGFIATLFAILAIVSTVGVLCKKLGCVAEDTKGGAVVWASVLFVSAIGVLIFTILQSLALIKKMDYIPIDSGQTVAYTVSFGLPIVVVVFAALCFASCVVQAVLTKKKKETV